MLSGIGFLLVSRLGTVSLYVLLMSVFDVDVPVDAIASADTASAQMKNTFFMVRSLIFMK